MSKILLKRGTTDKIGQFKGLTGEVVVDTQKSVLTAQHSEKVGGSSSLRQDDVKTKLSQFNDSDEFWTKTSLTKVSQLDNDNNFWSSSSLTKVSQLNNDSGFKNSYCSYCTYCSDCRRCYDVNCNQVRCSQVQCTQVQCTETKCTQYTRNNYDSDENHDRE